MENRILLMDDEEGVRTVTTMLLAKKGYDPVAVSDGEEAVSEFSLAFSGNHSFSAVILDLTVPGGMGGRETCAIIREKDHNVPIIATSGHGGTELESELLSIGFSALLQKPYRSGDIDAILRQLIGGPED